MRVVIDYTASDNGGRNATSGQLTVNVDELDEATIDALAGDARARHLQGSDDVGQEVYVVLTDITDRTNMSGLYSGRLTS